MFHVEPELWTTLASGACLAGGVLVARRFRRAAAIVCAGVFIVLLIRVALLHRPDLEANLLPWLWYWSIQPYWHYPMGFLVFGVGLWTLRRSPPCRRLAVSVTAVAALVWAVELYAAALVRLDRMRGVLAADGVCLQTTDYSCAPAAAVALLHMRGVAATEREMAALCRTTVLVDLQIC